MIHRFVFTDTAPSLYLFFGSLHHCLSFSDFITGVISQKIKPAQPHQSINAHISHILHLFCCSSSGFFQVPELLFFLTMALVAFVFLHPAAPKKCFRVKKRLSVVIPQDSIGIQTIVHLDLNQGENEKTYWNKVSKLQLGSSCDTTVHDHQLYLRLKQKVSVKDNPRVIQQMFGGFNTKCF